MVITQSARTKTGRQAAHNNGGRVSAAASRFVSSPEGYASWVSNPKRSRVGVITTRHCARRRAQRASKPTRGLRGAKGQQPGITRPWPAWKTPRRLRAPSRATAPSPRSSLLPRGCLLLLSRPRVSCGRALSKEARKGPMRQLLRLGRRNLRRDRCPARPLKRLAGCFSAVALSHCNNRSLARILVVHPRIASAPNRVVLLPLSQRGGSGQCELSS